MTTLTAHPLKLIVILAFLLPFAVAAQELAGTEEIDISGWVRPDSKLGITSFKGGELFMRCKLKGKGYYYALVAPEEYSSEGSSTQVTLRNVAGLASTLGYGLIFHSNPQPLVQDYAFLIDTVKKRFRVVRHENSEEFPVVPWTSSTSINAGKKSNTLEVKNVGDSVELYINGTMVKTMETPLAFKNGSPGIYTPALNIAFKGLKLTK